MNSPVPAANTAWIAAGVQHAVLTRTMPALRHELAGSVSVMRMGVAVLKRKIENSTDLVEKSALQQRVDAVDCSIADLSNSLRELRYWDRPTAEPIPSRTLLITAWELARPFLSMRGIALAELPPESAAWPEQPTRAQPLLYLLLASMYHFAEGASHTPASIHAELMDGSIRIVSEGVVAEGNAPHLLHNDGPTGTPVIDAASLRFLADHLHIPLRLKDDASVVIPLP